MYMHPKLIQVNSNLFEETHNLLKGYYYNFFSYKIHPYGIYQEFFIHNQ